MSSVSCASDPWQARCQEQVEQLCPVAVSPSIVRHLARKQRSGEEEDPLPLNLSYKVHIASVNNFPTAAGLASSAAGYACLGECPQGDHALEAFTEPLAHEAEALVISHLKVKIS